MPIIDVEVVGPIERKDLARLLANSAGEILESAVANTWVKLRSLSTKHYAENADLPPKMRPVFVSILLGRSYEESELAGIAIEMAASFSNILDRPKESIHILFEPNALGRIAFGGKLITK